MLLLSPSCVHATVNTPAEPTGARVARSPAAGSLPRFVGGSASALPFSRPAQRSLRVVACTLAEPPKAALLHRSASVQVVHLLKPLRLLPAGATVAGWVSHPLRNSAFSRRTTRWKATEAQEAGNSKRDSIGNGGRGDEDVDRGLQISPPRSLCFGYHCIHGATNKFDRLSSSNCSTETGSDSQHPAKAFTATPTSQGKIDLPLIRANGPSDSVNSRDRGIRLANSVPRLLANIAGPTLNQHPRATARSSSRTVPENQ